jgi:hypothetical protein
LSGNRKRTTKPEKKLRIIAQKMNADNKTRENTKNYCPKIYSGQQNQRKCQELLSGNLKRTTKIGKMSGIIVRKIKADNKNREKVWNCCLEIYS